MAIISATTRMLVISALALVVLSEDASARPIPNAEQPYTAKQPRQAGLISTSSLVVPPIPPLVVSRSAEHARKMLKSSSFTTMERGLHSSVHDDDRVDRRETKSHEHVHVHSHNDGYDYMYKYPDGWTAAMIAHHSKHWAEHHGLLQDHPYWTDKDHVHAHIHEHIHSRDGTEDSEGQPPSLTERGLVGDLIRPLLAPLNVIPGFVSISNLLFGDGVSDGGLLKTLGGLVLHVEKKEDTASDEVYSFSLVASGNDHTQVYLAPVNGSMTTNGTDKASNETSTSTAQEDTLAVQITLPLMNANGSAVLMCASYAVAPPSALNLEACHNNGTESADGDSKAKTSQLFTYTRSTGELTPTFIAQDESAPDPVQAAVQLSGFVAAKSAANDDDTTTSQTPKGNMTNTTHGDSSTTPGNMTTKSQVLMYFTPVSTMTSTNDTTVDGKTNATKTTTAMDQANSTTSMDEASSTVASPSSTTVITITQVLPPMNASRRGMDADSTSELSAPEETQGQGETLSDEGGDSSLDDEAGGASPSVVTKDDAPSTPVTTDTAVSDGEDDATQIFLAETNVGLVDALQPSSATMSITTTSSSSSSMASRTPTQAVASSLSRAAEARPTQDANHCPCFAEKK